MPSEKTKLLSATDAPPEPHYGMVLAVIQLLKSLDYGQKHARMTQSSDCLQLSHIVIEQRETNVGKIRPYVLHIKYSV